MVSISFSIFYCSWGYNRKTYRNRKMSWKFFCKFNNSILLLWPNRTLNLQIICKRPIYVSIRLIHVYVYKTMKNYLYFKKSEYSLLFFVIVCKIVNNRYNEIVLHARLLQGTEKFLIKISLYRGFYITHTHVIIHIHVQRL